MPCNKDMTEAVKRQVIYESLAAVGQEIAALNIHPNLWVIDGGGTPENTVIDFAANSQRICGIESVCMFGRGWKTYRPTSKYKNVIGEQCHKVIENRMRQWILFNADYWREIAQKGWTGSPGAPGSCSLPAGKHDDFIQQICREQLRGKDDVGGKTVWVWDTAPGPHDFGDCMTMAYVGAVLRGIGTAGQQVRIPRNQHKRRVTYVGV